MADSPFKNISVDYINSEYKQGYLTAAQRNDLMMRKAQDTLENVIENQGIVKTYFTETIKNVQSQWDDYLKMVDGYKPADSMAKENLQGLLSAGRLMWNVIGVATAPLKAFGDVNGEFAKHWAQEAGASAGLASVVSAIVNVGSGFVPIGKVSQLFAKGVQKVGAASATAAKGAGEAAEAAKLAKGAEKLADESIAKALLDDGVKPEKVIDLVSDATVLAGPKPGFTRFYRNDIKGATEAHGTHWVKDKDYLKGSKDYGEPNLYVDVPNSYPEIANTLELNNYIPTRITIPLNSDLAKSVKALGDLGEKIPPSTEFYSNLRRYHNEIKEVTEVKHIKDIEAQADKLGVTLDDVKSMGMGQQLTPAQTIAYLKTLDGPTNDLISNARKVIAGDAEAGFTQDRLLGEYFSYTPKFRSAQHESGLAVKVQDMDPRMKSITNMMAAWDPENMAKLALPAARRTVAEDLVAMADEAEKLKALQLKSVGMPDKGSPTFWTQLREGYVNLLLARPVTQVRNFMGNSFASVNSAVERELGGWLSIDDAKGAVKGEGMAQIQGMTAALADGIRAFGKAFTSVSPDDASKLDFIPHQIPGTLGRIINVPGDTLRGMDNFFKALLTRGDIYAQAIQMGRHQGLDGKALADYVSRRITLPTQGMMEHAKDFALNQTFQNDLGTLGKAAQKLAQTGPMVYLFPFMKTPMNLAKYAWNRTPGLQMLSGSLYDDILAGGARADGAIARLTMANMMGMFWYSMAKQGLVTGGGPVDPTLRRSWTATKQPYSLAGKDGWYPIANIEPLTTTINLIADFAEIHNQLDEPTAAQVAMSIALAGVRDIADKSYWQTVGQAVDFVSSARAGEEPGQNAKRLLTGPAVTVASGGPLTASIESAQDPVRREARGFLNQVKSRVPGFSADLPPMRDGYGDPLMPPIALGGAYVGIVSPFVSRPYDVVGGGEDRIKKEGSRLSAKLPMFPWSLGGKNQDDFDIRTALPGDPLPVELSPQQRDRWQVIYRNILRHPENGIEKALLDNPEYQAAPWAGQRDMFMNFVAKARGGAKAALMVEDTSLMKKQAEATVGKVLPMIQPEQRPQVEAQLGQSLDLIDNLPSDQKDNLLKWGMLDDGKARDDQVMRMEITKPLADLNAAAANPTPPAQ